MCITVESFNFSNSSDIIFLNNCCQKYMVSVRWTFRRISIETVSVLQFQGLP